MNFYVAWESLISSYVININKIEEMNFANKSRWTGNGVLCLLEGALFSGWCYSGAHKTGCPEESGQNVGKWLNISFKY